ncbi:MAG: hypothetical protein IJT37_05680 [Lachnospiraceae bacterium]|nr:hypothetical protein [Lachnospiraceae bacterium]
MVDANYNKIMDYRVWLLRKRVRDENKCDEASNKNRISLGKRLKRRTIMRETYTITKVVLMVPEANALK